MLMVLLFQKRSNRLLVSPDPNQLVPLEQTGNSIKQLRVTGTHPAGPAALDSSEVEAYRGSSSRKVGWVPPCRPAVAEQAPGDPETGSSKAAPLREGMEGTAGFGDGKGPGRLTPYLAPVSLIDGWKPPQRHHGELVGW